MAYPASSETIHPLSAPPARELPPAALAGIAAAPLDHVLAPLLLPGTLALVQGPRGVGLSQLMAGCAVALASGGSFFGWRAPRPWPVLLLAGGEPAGALARRVAAACRAAGAPPDTLDRLALVGLGPEAGLMPNLALRPGQLDFETLCRRAPVVMIDDMPSLLPLAGLECEQGGNMRHVLGDLRRRGQTAVIAIANGPEARRRADVTARAMVNGLADIVIDLAFPGDFDATDGCRFELRISRARHVAGPDRAPIEARLVTLDDGTPSWVVTPLNVGRRQRFLAMLNQGVPCTAAMRELRVPSSTAYRWNREYLDARYGLPQADSLARE